MNLTEKTVLVTGANRGIGYALVKALLNRGVSKIYAGARDPQKLPDFDDKRVVALTIDITNGAQVDAAANTAADVDLLINNAGVASFSSILDGPRDLVERDMNTNYFGTLDMVRAFVPILETKKDAAIVKLPDFDDERVVALTLDITNSEQVGAAANTAADVERQRHDALIVKVREFLEKLYSSPAQIAASVMPWLKRYLTGVSARFTLAHATRRSSRTLTISASWR